MGFEILKEYIPFIDHEEKVEKEKEKKKENPNPVIAHVNKIDQAIEDAQK